MATLNGSDLMLFVEYNGTKKSIAYATSHSLEISADTKDISTKDNGNGIWSNAEVGMMSWSTSSENLCCLDDPHGMGYNELVEIMLKRQPIEVCFALQSSITDYTDKIDKEFEVPSTGWAYDSANNYHGKAIITSLNLTAQNGEKANYSVQLQGAGALLRAGKGIQAATTEATASTQSLAKSAVKA